VVTITVHQQRVVLEGPVYQVISNVTATTDIEAEIFVHTTDSGLYSHVASVWDMDKYSNSRVTAEAAGDSYYRADTASVTYGSDISLAEKAAVYTLGRIDYLSRQYEIAHTGFIGEEDHSFPTT